MSNKWEWVESFFYGNGNGNGFQYFKILELRGILLREGRGVEVCLMSSLDVIYITGLNSVQTSIEV